MRFESNRTDTYVCTLTRSSEDQRHLETIRRTVSISNKGKTQKQRVVVRGRRPYRKEAIYNSVTRTWSVSGYDYSGNVIGGLENASEFDVYIYTLSR